MLTGYRIRSSDKQAREEALLVDRLVNRQGVSLEDALRLVSEHKQGLSPAIDPVMLEGLQTL